MSTGVAEMDATSGLTDLGEVGLQEISDTAPMAVTWAVARVIRESEVVAPGPSFSSTI
jgi:hypothetical protein